MKNILIIKTSALGDVIHTYPTIDYLAQKFPNAQIDWVVETPCLELVTHHPKVHKAIAISTKAWRKAPLARSTWAEIVKFRRELRQTRYDVVFDLQSNMKSGLVMTQARSPMKVGFGSKSVHEWPNMLFTNRRLNPPMEGNVRQNYLALATTFFGDEIPQETSSQVVLKIPEDKRAMLHALMNQPIMQYRPKILVCSGSAWRNKQLTPETLSSFLSLMQKELNCVFLFAWGSKEEQQVAHSLQQKFAGSSLVLDKMSLAVLQNLMGLCDLVVAMDSLPLHLAGTTSTPSFSVFGASSAAKYKPTGKQHGVFQGSCPYGKTFVRRCPILRTCSTGACIRDLKGQELFNHFRAWWEERG